MIISLLNQKGGVGKTTLSLNIAHGLYLRGYKVLVVDADPQQSALSWLESIDHNTPPPFNVIGFSKKTLHRDLPGICKEYDVTLIDGPPRVAEVARSCIMASDFVLIPCTPSAYDIWASAETINLVNEAKQYKENLEAKFIINRKIQNTAISRDALDVLREQEIPVFDAQITNRVVFAEASSTGKTVFDMEKNNKGSQEVETLVAELIEWAF